MDEVKVTTKEGKRGVQVVRRTTKVSGVCDLKDVSVM
jgi:hypothetical protein